MQTSLDLAGQDRYPKYGIRAAARLTGLTPGTLRAWERRYGVPSPGRRQNGHRLYTEYDIRLVQWLKAQTNAGLTIGRAVDFLNHLHSDGEDPIAQGSRAQTEPFKTGSIGGEANRGEFI
ncbi:MAG TPA: MerR family transcriptional regulator [Anaerolineales bacterium]|nr:MerR family transcriptional regulator [Anaerolineales bacterium]